MSKSYKTVCPICGNDTLYVTPHNGLSYCFFPTCNYYERDGTYTHKAKERSPLLEEIRGLYTQAAAYYHSALTQEALSFLYHRGFTDDTIQSLQIGYIPCGKSPMYKNKVAKDAGIATYDSQAFLADRISFPYFNLHNTVTDIRARALDPNNELRYKSPYNDAYFRGADYPFNYAATKGAQRIIITEGEIKSAIAQQYNYTTIAIPGITNWRKGFIQRPGQEVIILFDNQVNIRGVNAAIRDVASHLENPKVATMPLFGKEKQDIDSFILDYGINAFNTVVNGALDFDVWQSLQRI